jgi:hypothetical protein
MMKKSEKTIKHDEKERKTVGQKTMKNDDQERKKQETLMKKSEKNNET